MALVEAILDELPLEQRAVFVLFELEGLETESIADRRGIPVGTVYSRLHAARKAFRAALDRRRARERNQLAPDSRVGVRAMTSARRWVENGSGSTAEEQRLLREARNLDAPGEFADQLWERLSAAAVLTTATAVVAQAATSANVGAGAAKATAAAIAGAQSTAAAPAGIVASAGLVTGTKLATAVIATVLKAFAIGSVVGVTTVVATSPTSAAQNTSAGENKLQPSASAK